jgi:hypothetical protein
VFVKTEVFPFSVYGNGASFLREWRQFFTGMAPVFYGNGANLLNWLQVFFLNWRHQCGMTGIMKRGETVVLRRPVLAAVSIY